MQTLLEHCVAEAQAEGHDLSFLGGQRQRYRYFGYERAGVELVRQEDVTERVLPTLELASSWADRYLDPSLAMFGDHLAVRYPRLFRLAYGILRDRQAAEDASQDALVGIWRNLRRLRDPAAPRHPPRRCDRLRPSVAAASSSSGSRRSGRACRSPGGWRSGVSSATRSGVPSRSWPARCC